MFCGSGGEDVCSRLWWCGVGVWGVCKVVVKVMKVRLRGPDLCSFQKLILERMSVLSQQTFKYLTYQVS